MSRTQLIAIGVVVALATAGLAWRSRAPIVPVVEVQAAPLQRTLLFSARVASVSRVELGATLNGRVAAVLVREGAQVKTGQVLLTLEADEAQAALEQARAAEQQAQAKLAGLRSTGRRAGDAALAQAQAVLRSAQLDVKRQEDLLRQGFISQARLDEARKALEVAQAQVEAAAAQSAAQAEQGSDTLQAQAALSQARASVAAAQARLAQLTLRAPQDAKVLARMAEPGQIVQPGKALLSLALATPVQLLASVDERYLEQLRVGQGARVQADAFPGQVFEAQVLSLAPVIDPARGAVEVKLSLPQSPAQGAPAFLREDMTLSVEVETGRREQALVLPLDALQPGASRDQARVFVVQDGRIQPRTVRLGLRTLDAAEVLEGLKAGEQVVRGAAPAAGAKVRAEPKPMAATGAATSGDNAGATMASGMGR